MCTSVCQLLHPLCIFIHGRVKMGQGSKGPNPWAAYWPMRPHFWSQNLHRCRFHVSRGLIWNQNTRAIWKKLIYCSSGRTGRLGSVLVELSQLANGSAGLKILKPYRQQQIENQPTFGADCSRSKIRFESIWRFESNYEIGWNWMYQFI